MRIVQITEDKREEMADMLEEMLTIGGRLMSSIEQLSDDSTESTMGRRRPYPGTIGMRRPMDDGYGDRYGDYWPSDMGMRRDSRGRYMPR